MNTRHYDDGTSIYDFTDCFLVRCPKCVECAEVTWIDSEQPVLSRHARFCCPKCAVARTGTLNGWSVREPVDWVFGLPLWLQVSCCGKTLWAYNFAHLAFIESYVNSEHRIGLNDADAERLGRRNSTLASRLPAWMIAAKNRKHVLRAIQKLRAKEFT